MRLRLHRLMTTIGCLVAVTGLSGCDFLETYFAPCPIERDLAAFATNKVLLDGSWTLKTIDGNPIPAGGYKLPPDPKNPTAPAVFLLFGTMNLITTATYQGNDCGAVKESSGYIKFFYETRMENVSGTAGKQYTGRFHRDHEENKSTIGADKYTLPLIVTGSPFPQFATATATIGFAAPERTYVLRFERTLF